MNTNEIDLHEKQQIEVMLDVLTTDAQDDSGNRIADKVSCLSQNQVSAMGQARGLIKAKVMHPVVDNLINEVIRLQMSLNGRQANLIVDAFKGVSQQQTQPLQMNLGERFANAIGGVKK